MKLERMEITNTPGRIFARIVLVPIFFAILGPIIGVYLGLALGGLASVGVPVPVSSVALLIGVPILVLGLKLPAGSTSSKRIGLAVALVIIVLGFVAFWLFGFLTFLMMPFYAYETGGFPAFLTGIAFAVLITFKAPENLAFVLCGLVGALTTLNSLLNSEFFKSDRWDIVIVGAVSAVLTGWLLMVFRLHFPGIPRSESSGAQANN